MSWWETILGKLGLGPLGRNALSPEQFTERYRREFLRTLPPLRVEITEPLCLKIVREDKADSRSNLHNAYDLYLHNREDLDRIISHYVQSFSELEAQRDEPINPERVVSVIKDTGWLRQIQESIAGLAEESPKEQLVDPLNEDLVVAYAEDKPTCMRYLTVDNLDELKISREDLRKQAGENLLDLLPPPEMHQGQGFYMVMAGGDYEASLITVPRFWTKDRFPLEGDLVAAIPSRDVLLVTGTGEETGLARVREIVKDVYQQATYKLTEQLYVIREGGVIERLVD